jgi:predicted HicB family RNase H-like nuclease
VKKFLPKELTGFRVTKKLKEAALKAARMESRSMSNYIENLLCKDLQEKKISYERGT